MKHLHPYATAKQMFGRAMSAACLVGCVRNCAWKSSFQRLAELAALVANAEDGPISEEVRRRTVDSLLELAGRPDSQALLARCRAVVSSRRNDIIVAHDEAISFLQHLVLLEGSDKDQVPTDSEISLWLLGANDHLSRWNEEARRPFTDAERLMAEMTRIARFNNRPDVLRELVRTYLLFRTAPPLGKLSEQGTWKRLQEEAFSNSTFDLFFEAVLGPLYMIASTRWGILDGPEGVPIVRLREFFANTRLPQDEAIALLRSMSGTRTVLCEQIRKRLRSDGLPHAPTALLHRPFVEVEPDVLVASSPDAVRSQLETGLWWRYLSACKRIDPKGGAEMWLSSFGYMVECWCRRVAKEVQKSRPSAKILISEKPGDEKEIEDVVVIEDDAVVLFSVKGRLMEARVAREAASPDLAGDWFENFFFETRHDGHRGGAIRLLNAKIDSLRAGNFEKLGVPRSTRVYPVVVTFDNLCAVDLHYQWLDERCQFHRLLQQEGVGPLALARLAEFEDLMALLWQRGSMVSLLRGRESADRHRRLDQLIFEAPQRPPRLPFLEAEYEGLCGRIMARLFGRPAASD